MKIINIFQQEINMSAHSIFKLYPMSPHITTKDVREAIKKTKRMPPRGRLKYFHNRGMHYSRCIKYIDVVEKLQQLYDTDVVEDAQQETFNIIINDVEDTKLSMKEIGQFIEELLKELPED